MWHFISEQIGLQLDSDFICSDIRNLAGGHTHQAFKITGGRRRFFVKINQHQNIQMFHSEAEGLNHLRVTGLLKIPRVICLGTVGRHSFIVLEYFNLTPGDNQTWFAFGQQLAKQHREHTQNMYGWQSDNYIGATIQVNQWHKNWNFFFAEQRIGYLLQLLAEKGFKLAKIDAVIESVKQLLAGHNPVSSMLHGDLWQGNVGFHNLNPVVFDPALYYGDRETDLAMSELFSRFPNPFYDGYQAIWPLETQYQYRKPVYQLYHLLNHALIFGGHYVESAKVLLKNMED
jgi:fructosamine-3-kinase